MLNFTALTPISSFLGRPVLPHRYRIAFTQFPYTLVAIHVSVQYCSHVWVKSLIPHTLFSQRDIALHAPVFYLRDCAYPGRIYSCFSREAVYGKGTEWPP